ncbi:hypothetical protein ESCO_002063 [Escovopsis weberi]|uniref:Uncharacterized protein n=1 Tax=Escovopsis weberi TaxID=150374 RepID=A0A0M8N7Q8_ESCWE|nr:hypothetical protein ESCO_002063 [Escovopsis weberi]
MSRNIRRKLPVKPLSKPRKRRDSDSSSSLDLSDDGGYSAVEDISDSEDDDEDDVNAVEEESILAEGTVKSSIAPRPPLDAKDEEDLEDEEEEGEGEDEDDNDDNDDDDEEDEEDDQEEQESIEIDEGDADDNASWGGIASEADESQASDFYSEATHLASDIAVERRTALDPAFRREIEHDPDESSGSGSFWDYHGQYEEEGDDSDSDAEEIIRRLSDDEAPMTVPGASEATNGIADFTPAFEETLELDGYESEFGL